VGQSGVREIDPKNDLYWDEFVDEHPFGWICHRSIWKKILENSFSNLKGHYLIICGIGASTIQSALPIFEIKSRITGNRFVSIPFASLCDPLISCKRELNLLIDSVFDLANKLKIPRIEVRTHISTGLINDERLLPITNYKHHFLLLDADLEVIKKSFHRSCVQQKIAKAEESNMTLHRASNEKDIRAFYWLHLITRKRLGLPPHPYCFIKNLWLALSPSNNIEIILAKKHEEYIAGILLLKYKNRVSAEYLACDYKYIHFSPNHYIIWEAIKSTYEQGYKIFDFGRSSSDCISLISFKSRWNTKVIDLTNFYYPEACRRKIINDHTTFLYKTVKIGCTLLPAFILPSISKIFYRHIF
jgi:hypothetical protein